MPEFTNPPLWLLRKTIFSEGRRLINDRPEWKEPVVVSSYRPAWKPQDIAPRRAPTWFDKALNQTMTLEGNKVVPYKGGEFAVIPKKVIPGNLDKGEYFQFIGMPMPLSVWSKCRACEKVFWNELARKEHKNGCGKILQDAYRLLRADKHRPTNQFLCVICNQATAKLIWGVPLCPGKCEENWKFGGEKIGCERIPNALRLAIDLVKKSTGAK